MEVEIKPVVRNRSAQFEYQIFDRFEAGISLLGSEVKSIREGKVSLEEAYAQIENGEVFIYDMHISPYEKAHHLIYNPKRPRKLLLHNAEIKRLIGKTQLRGFTIIPIRLYFKGKWAKLELALARGKKQYEKREIIKKRLIEKELQRALKREK